MTEHNDGSDPLAGFEIIDPVTGQVLEKVEWPGMYEMINPETGETGVIIFEPTIPPSLLPEFLYTLSEIFLLPLIVISVFAVAALILSLRRRSK